MDICNVVLPV